MSKLYEFHAQSLEGKDVSLADFQGQVLLIVNTASKCGFTPQYEGLEKLYERYNNDGFQVLGFPCNQFGHQEPGGESEIGAFCQKNYGVKFPMFAKVDVNGGSAHPLFRYLKHAKPGLLGESIRWNFTKFLIDRRGEVVSRFAPLTKPEKLDGKVEALLAEVPTA